MKRSKRRAVSILEILIVVVIVGIISALGVVLIGTNRNRIELARNLFVSKVYEMRQRAISVTQDTIIRITPGENFFQIDLDAADASSPLRTINLPDQIIMERVDGSTAVYDIQFQDNGTVTAASVGGVRLRDTGTNREVIVNINRVGAVQIQ